ncbi:MAG: NYN domain-containing protein [Nitrospirae bacterium]|nr:NYN domain-containing protein [Nitrospirota bacterium]
MSHILIDGYNLLGIAHHDLEKARDGLVQRLKTYAGKKGHNITIVFDGWKGGYLTENRTRSGNVTVIYSRLGEKADSVINRILSEEKRAWIVVSSDREISDFAEAKDLTSITSGEFEGKLIEKPAEGFNVRDEVFIKDEDYLDIELPRKGNPRRPSKRQRQKLRALKKL